MITLVIGLVLVAIRQIELRWRGYFINDMQIMHKGIWGHVAGEKWTMENAQVVCRQLKKPGVKSFKLIKTKTTSENRLFWLKGVRCQGDEKNLMDCPRNPWLVLKNESFSNWKAVVECNKGMHE